MDEESLEAIDFKPFFDMVVGVLFILLILVAAQMFFAQWRPDASALTPQDLERQRREELDLEIQQFLGRLEARFRAVGQPAAVDRVGRIVTLPLGSLRVGGGGWLTPALAGVGSALRSEASCLGQGVAPEPDCPSYRHLRLARLEAALSLPAPGEIGSPSPGMRVEGMELAAALFRQTPDLLALRSPAGGPAVDAAVRLEPSAVGGAGRLDLRFGFAEAR